MQPIGCEGFATPLWSVSHCCDQMPEDFRGRFTVAHSFWSLIGHGEEDMAEPFSTHHSDQEADSAASRKGTRKNNSPKGVLPQTYVTQPSPSSRLHVMPPVVNSLGDSPTGCVGGFCWKPGPQHEMLWVYFMFKTLSILRFQCGWREWFPEPTFRGERNGCI